MKSRLSRGCVRAMLLVAMLAPSVARGRKNEPEREMVDARYEGYETVTSLDPSGTTVTWLFFGVLAVIGCAGLFKNAKRTHLD